ncbi:MAG TPA: HAD-IC family P-type ATPase [Polyangiaceae bacterium]
MQDAKATSSAPSSQPTCPACGKALDPLRAGQVAIVGGTFVYYCDAQCKRDAYEARSSHVQQAMTADPPPVAEGPAPSLPMISSLPVSQPAASSPPVSAPPPVSVPKELPPVSGERASAPKVATEEETAPIPLAPSTLRSIAVASNAALVAAAAAEEEADDEAPARSVVPSSRARRSAAEKQRQRNDVIAAVGFGTGLLAAALVLGGAGLESVRAGLAALAVVLLAARAILAPRDPSSPNVLAVLGPPAGALAIALFAHAHADPHASSLVSLAGLAAAGSLLVASVVERAFEPLAAERAKIAKALAVDVAVVQNTAKEDEVVKTSPADVKAGEHVVVEAGSVVGVDALVVAGTASVLPWLGARVETKKTSGDAIVAGAKIVSGRLRLVTTWAGNDRAWLRLAESPTHRLEVASPTARLTRTLVERAAPIVSCVIGVVAYTQGASPVEAIGAAWASTIALGAWGVSRIVALHHARMHASALEHGVVFKDARALADAGTTDVAVVCARGTVLMGEPEIVALEATGNVDADRMLSLAAGAEAASVHPFASAILRAARARGIRSEAVRNASVHEGLGVTALSAAGEHLVVGGRALLLRERVSVAAADARITELEAEGRSVLLVALGDKLIGIVALQDGLRAGARGAVQRLHDARIEPVLMSGEARETCETIARALDIDHVRPEVPPNERGAQVRALAEGGHVVAVLGHPDADDGALGAADVAVAMSAAGATPGEWSIALASDDVRDAAFALKLARSLRDRVRTATIIGFVPSALVALGLAFGAMPLALAPLVVAAASLAALGQARPKG